jgi:hypothetical protein
MQPKAMVQTGSIAETKQQNVPSDILETVSRALRRVQIN